MTSPSRIRSHLPRVGAALVLLSAVGCGGGAPEVTDGGPLAGIGLASGATTVATPARPGKPVMYGLTQVVNDGKAKLTLDRVRFVDRADSLRVVDTYAVGPGDGGRNTATDFDWTSHPEYPRLHPVKGYVVAPGGRERRRSVRLLLVVRPGEEGVQRAKGVRIDYRVGDRRYRRTLKASYAVCVVPRSRPRECPEDVLQPD